MPGRLNKSPNYAALSGKKKKNSSESKKGKVSTSSDTEEGLKDQAKCDSNSDVCNSTLELQELKDQGECSSCNRLISLVESLTAEDTSLRDEVKQLRESPSDTSSGSNGDPDPSLTAKLEEKIDELAERIESRTNRQLRKTLILKRVPESNEEKHWSDTRVVVAKQFASLLNISEDEAARKIDRCHRGGKKSYYKKEKKDRPIYIAMLQWDDCETLVRQARQGNVHLEYKFGPMTTQRRNMALLERKKLKEAGKIGKAYIKFPAILMAMQDDGKYHAIENFSTRKVTIKPRDEDQHSSS